MTLSSTVNHAEALDEFDAATPAPKESLALAGATGRCGYSASCCAGAGSADMLLINPACREPCLALKHCMVS